MGMKNMLHCYFLNSAVILPIIYCYCKLNCLMGRVLIAGFVTICAIRSAAMTNHISCLTSVTTSNFVHTALISYYSNFCVDWKLHRL